MSAPIVRGRALALRRVQGIAFLAVLALLVGLTVAMYQKAFTEVVHVRVQADRVGNQLTQGADVKVRGLLIGEVRSVSSDGGLATLDLALDPEKARLVPSTATARFLPKTLFGEKFVDLVPEGSGDPLADGDVITQDRSSAALETEKAVDDLLPLLRALRPQELSSTLNALSAALRDRGDQLGANLARTADYLTQLNPALPTLRQDFDGLADFATSSAEATPDLLRVLDNLSFSSRSLVDQQDELDTFLGTTTTLAASAQSIVADNERRLVALARDSVPVLQTYAKQARGGPCLFASLAALEPVLEKTFGGNQPGLHITVEVTRDNGAYVPGQEPVYADTGGTRCRGLDPAHPEVPMLLYYNPNDGYFDGMEVDPYTGKPPCTHTPCAYPPNEDGSIRGSSVAEMLLRPVLSGTTVRLEK